ncbi:MAG: DUF2023 family protein [Bacteroidales bacterium]|nr:DUF2023 family protein [Bacteroidales bacterium]
MPKEGLLPAPIKVLAEQIYLYQKGVRPLVLFTCNRRYLSYAERLLGHHGIPYIVKPIGKGIRLNLFFGKAECLQAIRILVKNPITALSPEEDFILGALLGYDLSVQCERYCHRKTLTALSQKTA